MGRWAERPRCGGSSLAGKAEEEDCVVAAGRAGGPRSDGAGGGPEPMDQARRRTGIGS
jgi:hypothetical protein